jgi:amidase
MSDEACVETGYQYLGQGAVPEALGAFMPYEAVGVPNSEEGRLKGLHFAVKDLFDVVGYPTGCGHPLWGRQSGTAICTAAAVQTLLDQAAVFAGKTMMDELAYGLYGKNPHYGTPINPVAPERMPGGSSSGSAVAVSAKTVDFALGSDTGGSVRAPASHCGIWGIRPTHNAISMAGVAPLAPSFDTVGWLAPSGHLLRRIGLCLLPPSSGRVPCRLLIVQDTFDLLSGDTGKAFREALLAMRRRMPVRQVRLSSDGFAAWAATYALHQDYEVWRTLGDWVVRFQPDLGSAAKNRLRAASKITAEQYKTAIEARLEIQAKVSDICGDDAAMVIPTMPGVAPLRSAGRTELSDYANNARRLLCISGLCGLPQISMPAAHPNRSPLGLSIIGSVGNDLGLLDLAVNQLGEKT